MKVSAALHFSLVKESALPIALLVSCVAGIMGLAIFDAFTSFKREQAPEKAVMQASVAGPRDAGAFQGKAEALQGEIESLQAHLFADLKKTTGPSDTARSQTLENQLARLSVAAGELHGMQRDFDNERAALKKLGVGHRSAPGSEDLPGPSAIVRHFLPSVGIVLLAIVCLGAGMTIVRRISRTIAQPVDHLVESALAITRGRLKHRASPAAAGHFGPLAEAFNQMIEARQLAEARLQQAHDSLEFKVQARTIELFRSNKALLEESQQRAQAERDFQQAQKMEALGKLAGSMAHDFNNLLTVIINGAESAQAQLAPDHPAVRLLQTVLQASERAAGLTRPLLTFSRSQVLALETVNLNAAAEEASHMLQRLLGVNIQFSLDLAPELYPVQANSNQIQQVIMNLAVNARDAMNGFGRLTIITRPATIDESARERAGVSASEHWVELAVADTGTGMDEATKARIFEPFFTTKPAGRGTGLGLATVFGIVKQSNGILSVESVLGEGSTFRVFLPASAEPMPIALPVALPAAVAAPLAVHEEAPCARGEQTVLLVDDEEDLRELAAMTLEAEGYRVLSAANAADAIRIAEKHTVEIRALVTDVLMPGMNGVELAGLLLQLIPGLRVLFVSGYNNESISSDTLLATQSDYLQKPYRGHVLATKVHEILTAQSLRPSAAWSAEDFAEAV